MDRLKKLLPKLIEPHRKLLLVLDQSRARLQALGKAQDIAHLQPFTPPHSDLGHLKVENAPRAHPKIMVQSVDIIARVEPHLPHFG
eukprot:CAMPEP_0204501356 /NCGR_PEP_ID=MMETSP0471-20130131/99088_1 /ASSEMBLY_ACC=CAM_ASM_000602 /TAXON_ID=2969 /ORGANISM="Oxyrrhis marina" /LENGTH=85 /DNA_ID=CAMNT_0051506031 /DNA_START=143 /DNA_END=397 /DNA_ORIENTATION=+